MLAMKSIELCSEAAVGITCVEVHSLLAGVNQTFCELLVIAVTSSEAKRSADFSIAARLRPTAKSGHELMHGARMCPSGESVAGANCRHLQQGWSRPERQRQAAFGVSDVPTKSSSCEKNF